ncbi:lipase secretion chaperone [Arenicella chitinivorans]|uniref:lipase secretion chaperone n=1 Tax=Arenicella chitinivorans TaxID=1329800 RepID=UPI001679A8F0|nr:lipase secretion chaperone [Arenicella chitinivorans]
MRAPLIQTSMPIRQIVENPLRNPVYSEVHFSTPNEHDQVPISESLRGTNIDGALQADKNGELILSIGVRDFFDYFLSTADEVGIEAAVDEIIRYASGYLPAPANQQALDLLRDYLEYKRFEYAIQQVPINGESLTDKATLSLLRESYQQLRQARAQRFSSAANQALFGLEDTYAEFTLSSLELGAIPDLTDVEKTQRVESLIASLPPELANEVRQERAQAQLERVRRQHINSDIDDSQLHQQLVEQGYTQSQADHVIRSRQQQQEFNRRYQQYQQARSLLDQNAANYGAEVAGLRQRSFVTPEEATQAALRDLGQARPN